MVLALVLGLEGLGRVTVAAEPEGTDDAATVVSTTEAATNLSGLQDAEALRRAIDELRHQVNTSSKELLTQTARDAETLSRKVDAAVAERLAAMERSLSSSQQRELESLRNSHRTFLMFAGVLAGLGFLGIIATAVVLARAVNRFSEVALTLPGPSHALPAPPERPSLGPGDAPAISPAQVEEATSRFQEAVKRLEDRIRELENLGTVSQAAHEGNGGEEGVQTLPTGGDSALKLIASAVEAKHPRPLSTMAATATRPPSEFALLLGKGQALLNLGKAQEALACFEEAIALAPRNAEAHVKRGLALERLQRMDQAIESYDQALAVDGSSTLAYLYKGAVCNRLQRFQEALECYEKALKTEQMSAAV
jgi:tetratricopeptide (TPR) repeat protein